MNKVFWDIAWKDYLYWQENDRKILRKINELIKSIEREGALKGLGKPETLKGDLSGMFSRHITHEHRLIYFIKNDNLFIVGCKTHYGDK